MLGSRPAKQLKLVVPSFPTFYKHSIQTCMNRNLPYAQKLTARHSTGTQGLGLLGAGGGGR